MCLATHAGDVPSAGNVVETKLVPSIKLVQQMKRLPLEQTTLMKPLPCLVVFLSSLLLPIINN